MARVGRYIPLIGLAALVPVVIYAVGRGDAWIAFSVVCVLLIVGSLRWMTKGSEEEAVPHSPSGDGQ